MNKMNSSKRPAPSGDVAAASMVELKAELYRKQMEYQHQKPASAEGNYLKGHKIEKKPDFWSKSNTGVNKRIDADEKTRSELNTEESLLAKSRQALEAKSLLYEKMSKTGDNYEDDDGNSFYLVDFERKFIDKALEEREKRLHLEKSSTALKLEGHDTIPEYKEDATGLSEEDQWVDYVDSLGRSRRCMKKDLPKILELDRAFKGDNENKVPPHQLNKSGVHHEEPHLLSDDMRREMLREKWEKEQREMLENQDTVHYSNVQFDELRSHGVAFYQFSKSEEERRKEMEKLNKMREDTKVNRENRERLKEKRKALLDARLEKVKQRRIAQGKPVPETRAEESGSEDEDIIGPVLPKEEPEKDDSPLKTAEIREWDRGKPGLLIPQRPQKPKGWINPRDKRDEDFAPPSFYYSAQPNGAPQKIISTASTSDTLESRTLIKGADSIPQQSMSSSHYTIQERHDVRTHSINKFSSETNTEEVNSIPLPNDPKPIHVNPADIETILRALRQQS